MAAPDDEDRTVADSRKATQPARAVTDEEATRVEPLHHENAPSVPTVVAGSGEVPIVRELRARERERERLAPPVPPSPPRHLPMPSAPTDPGLPPNFNPSAPTAPNHIITDEEATRLAPKDLKKKPKPGPPLVRRPVARQALARIRRFTSEMSAVSISSKSPKRRRTSRLFLALLAGLSVVMLAQLYRAFTSSNAEMARPMGKKAEEPGAFEKLFKW